MQNLFDFYQTKKTKKNRKYKCSFWKPLVRKKPK